MSVPASAVDNFDSVITAINGPVSSFAWGWPTVGLISITGVLPVSYTHLTLPTTD